MNFTEAISSAFSKYATGEGRALRSEYWYFTLFLILADIVSSVIDTFLLGAEGNIGIVGIIFTLGTLVPSIAVAIRRLHDVGRSGWWVLIPLTIIGIIPYLYWMCIEGEQGENQYGPPIS